MPLEPGQRLAHYRIERLIGQGGMGKVFLAEDTKLHRKVALKVLPAEMASHADRLARFRREAQAVAALNHPHIVTLFSVEEAEGTHVLIMELVEGTSLDQEIRRGGLPLARVFDVGIALADALAAAHEKGIIHRDLKPANVMVTKDGRVKVLDFGLARLALEMHPGVPDSGGPAASEASTEMVQRDQSLTAPGVVVGTVPYMSPEQVGGKAVDARTDIFSLGVVLYEMATGRRPFEGKSVAETISSILRDAPRPVTEARQDAPRHLGRIIDHCLQKDPRDRFQTARDVFNELRALRNEVDREAPASRATAGANVSRRWAWVVGGIAAIVVVGMILTRTGSQQAPQHPAAPPVPAESQAAGPDPKSIAVLPFVNMSEDQTNEYFSDGVSEELLNLLAKIPQLKLSARTSSFSFKGKEVEIPEIARQLHVANVLEGSVRKSGNQVRITAQLIHAADGYQMWSRTWDRRLDDIFKIQDEIAADVVKALEVTLLGAAPKARTTDPQAYALYLQAVQLGRQFTAEAFEKSDALYRQVLTIDSGYAPAWMGLADNSLVEGGVLGFVPLAQAYGAAREATEKALAIDPDYAPAHARLGWIATTRDNDLAGAARHFERSLMLDPTDLGVLGNAANFLRILGRLDEVLALDEAIVRRDPVNHQALFSLGTCQRFAGRFDEAIASYRTALSLSPGMGSVHAYLGNALLLKGDAAGALAEIEQETSEVWRMIGRPLAYHALGRSADSDAALAALAAKHEKDSAYNIAYVFAFRGEADQAFAWLDKAIEYGDPGLSELVVDNLFAGIHSDPRWLPFLRGIGRAPEQLAKIKFKVTLPEDLLK